MNALGRPRTAARSWLRDDVAPRPAESRDPRSSADVVVPSDELRPRTAKEFVLSALRRQILTGQLPGGARLVQGAIASELRVSTTPVREALHDLAAEGLIRLEPHHSAVVSLLERDQLIEIFELRRVLEPMAVRLAIGNLTAADVDGLDRLRREMEGTADIPKWVELHRDFHGRFLQASGWPRLAAIAGALHDSASPFVAMAMQFTPTMRAEGIHDHAKLVEAARRRDTEAAVNLALTHMDVTIKVLTDRIRDGEPEPTHR